MFVHLVFDGVADGPLGVALDVVATAARVHPEGGRRLRQRLVSVDGAPVLTGAGRVCAVDGALSVRGLSNDDVVVLAGVGAATPTLVDALLARDDVARVLPVITRATARNVVVAASCSATFVLGAAGILDHKEATTTSWLAVDFTRRFPRAHLAVERMVVDAGSVVTAGSAFAHTDLMLALLARVAGPRLAHRVARVLVLDERPSQARYMALDHVRTDDPALRRLEGFVAKNLHRQIEIEEMARAAQLSPRTLARRVRASLATTPLRFVQRLRVARAVHLLETTRLCVDDVATRVGYADAAAFRRIFRRETGETPRARRGAG